MDFVFSPTTGDNSRKKYGQKFTNRQLLDVLKQVKKLELAGGIIIYFTNYMISPTNAEKTDEKTRNSLIKEITAIFPDAIIEILPWIIDPGSLKMEKEEIFKYYCTYQ